MPAPIDCRRALAAALLLPCAALAQTPSWPSPEDVARALKAHPFPTPDQIDAQRPRPLPRVPTTRPDPGAVDLSTLARQGAALTAAPTNVTDPGTLRIFITLEMPRGSLQRLVDQASRSGAVLVLRGLKAQSLRETLAAVRDLVESRRVAWVIDPDAFTRYGVTSAPTFVLALEDAPSTALQPVSAEASAPRCGKGCALPGAFVSVAGDVSLDYALEAMTRRSPQVTPRASAYIERLRGS